MHKLLLALAGALALGPAPALAADATLTRGGPAFEWDGGPGNGLLAPTVLDTVDNSDPYQCTAVQDCEEKLIKTEAVGDLAVEMSGKAGQVDDGMLDLDLYILRSDADGTPGENLAGYEGATASASEAITLFGAEPGYYLVRVVFYQGIQATFDASARLREPVPAAGG